MKERGANHALDHGDDDDDKIELMNRLAPEILAPDHHAALASELKDRVPPLFEDPVTAEDLDKATQFIANPFGPLDILHGHPLAWEYQEQIERLQGTPLFRELQEAAREHLARGYESQICICQAFLCTIAVLPELADLKMKYEEEEGLVADEDVREMFHDLEGRILTGEKAKKCFFENLINNVPDVSPSWDERRGVVEFIKRQAVDRERFLVGDFGCGVGEWARKFKEQLGDAVTIFASDQQYHGEASPYDWAPEEGLTFFRANFLNIPLPDESLDCALLLYVVPHITEDAAAKGLREVERVLKEGGCLIVGPTEKKGSWEGGWVVLRKEKGVLVESEAEFIT